jgi:hypothetical protein
MQHEEVSTWFILTLSAEQAALDQDFEHLDALLHRREELLTKWENTGFKIPAADAPQLETAEQRLDTALRRVKEALGGELQVLQKRRKAVGVYKAA